MSALDIVLISLGALAVVIYATLKTLQVIKFKKYVKLGIESGLTELEARQNATQVVYGSKKKQKVDEVNENDTQYDE